jgi:hypothetical protein
LLAVSGHGILNLSPLADAAPTRLTMPAKCPYCARPLRGFGLKCRACRRYVLRWHHVLLLAVIGLAALAYTLDFLFRTL